MDILATFTTDPALESEGRWVTFSKDSEVLVARAGNPKYTELLRTKLTEAQLDLLPPKEADAAAEKILIEVAAQTILLGWRGFTEGGVPVPYSTAKAAQYLALKDFRGKITKWSEDFDGYRVKAEAAQGNG